MNSFNEQLGALSNYSINFAISTLLYAVVVALFTLSMYEFGLRGFINKRLLIRWLRIRDQESFYSFGIGSILKTLSVRNFYQLSYRQLCAQIYSKIELAIQKSENTELFAAFSDTKLNNLSSKEETFDKLSSVERSVDDLQAYMRIWSVRTNYVLSIFIALIIGMFIFVFSDAATPSSIGPTPTLICFIAGIIAPVGQRFVEEWLSSR